MSSRQIVTNTLLQSVMLDSGQQLGAAGTRESSRDDVRLSAGERERYVETGKFSVVTVEEVAAAPAEEGPRDKAEAPRPARARQQQQQPAQSQ